jgi:HD-like signal output (HDOD) protein
MPQMTLALADDLLDDLKIPPQPEILNIVQNEIAKENPNLGVISDAIIKDGGLFSSVLRLINSPYFGMRCEIKTVQHAISLIGIDNLKTNIACIKFREQMGNSTFMAMPRYWDVATDTAKMCTYLSKELAICSPSQAYAFGLFKDAGIPILAQRHVNYKDVLAQQNQTELRTFTDLEDKNFNTNHTIVSFLVSKKWGMDKSFREACLYHHDIDYIIAENFNYDQEARKLILLMKMAEFVTNMKRNQHDYEWLKIKDFTLFYFGLSEHDFDNLCDEMLELIN